MLHAWFAFIRNYVLRAGFKDGRVGLIVSVLNSYYVFLKLAKLWERQRRGTPLPPRRAEAPRPQPRTSSPGPRGPSAEPGEPNPEPRTPRPEPR